MQDFFRILKNLKKIPLQFTRTVWEQACEQ